MSLIQPTISRSGCHNSLELATSSIKEQIAYKPHECIAVVRLLLAPVAIIAVNRSSKLVAHSCVEIHLEVGLERRVRKPCTIAMY